MLTGGNVTAIIPRGWRQLAREERKKGGGRPMLLMPRSQAGTHWLNLFAAVGHGIVASFVLWNAECGKMPVRMLLFAAVAVSALCGLVSNFRMLMQKLPELPPAGRHHHRH